jgi:hypothetical protein
MDDVYGLIDGVKNGLGKAVLPRHLIEGEKDLEVIHPKQVLKVSVYLHFCVQPYYRAVHESFIKAVQNHFARVLR